MSARKMTDAEKEEFIFRLSQSDPVFAENYQSLVKTTEPTDAMRESIEKWLIQSAQARYRRAAVRATL